jgi:hypothetical protein
VSRSERPLRKAETAMREVQEVLAETMEEETLEAMIEDTVEEDFRSVFKKVQLKPFLELELPNKLKMTMLRK